MSGYKDFSCDLKLTYQRDSRNDWYRIISSSRLQNRSNITGT